MLSRRIWWLWVLLFLWLFPGRGESENLLQQVRFGYHGEFSRVVFDLQKETPYRIVTDQDSRTIVVEFDHLSLSPTPHAYQPRDPLVREVRFLVTPTKAMGEIVLKHPGKVKKHFRMDAPPRIVIDIIQDRSIDTISTVPVTEDASPTTPAQTPKDVTSAPGVTRDQQPAQSNQVNLVTAVKEKKTKDQAAENLSLLSAQEKLDLPPAKLLEQAERALVQRYFEAAQQSYATFLARFPQDSNNHLVATHLADILREQKDYPRALAAYAEVIEKYPASEGAIISQMRMAELGLEFPDLLPATEEKRYEPYYHPLQALTQLSETYPLSPLSGVALFKAGVILFQRNELPVALEKFQQVLDRYKEETLQQEVKEKFAQTMERLLVEQREPEKLLELLRTFFRERERLQETTAYPDLLFAVAESYAQLSLLDEAQSILQKLINTAPTPQQRARASLKQAILLFRSGQIEEVKALLTPVDQFTESSIRGKALLLLGEVALQEHRPQEAMQYLAIEKKLITSPADQVTLHYLQGKGYQLLGEENNGLRAFQKCTEITVGEEEQHSLPLREQCLFQVGNILLGQKKYQEALSVYQTVLDSFPQSSRREWILLQIAQIYRQLADEQGMINTLTTLRASTSSPFWQLMATEHLKDFQWRKHFDPVLAEFQNNLLR